MKILENKSKLDDLLKSIKAQGISIGLIPTMGSIHNGHLSLVKKSKDSNSFSIVTIFINPTQFNDFEDFVKARSFAFSCLSQEEVFQVEF